MADQADPRAPVPSEGPVAEPSDLNLRVPEAVWWATMPTYDQLESHHLPSFFASGLSGSGRNRIVLACRVVPKLLRHPWKCLHALRRGKRPHELLRFGLWLASARFFEVSVLREPDMSVSVFSRFLPVRPRPARMTPEPKIAAVIITQNRGPKLRVALGCVKQLASSIIVVDGGSTDDTEEIARSSGAIVVHRRFDQNFAAQRNAGLRHAGDVDWVFRIDDDESFSPEFGCYIQDVLAAAADFDSVVVAVHTFTPERWGSPVIVPVALRPSLRYRSAVHEQPTWSRPLFCPLSSPGLENRKSYRDLLVAALLYGSIRPADFPPGFLEDASRQLAQMDGPEDAG